MLAFKYADGVIVAGDRLATEGLRVASRDVQKVYATDDHSMIAIAGAAGPAIEMARIMRIELEHYEKIEGQALELDGKANKLSQMIRANLPAAMQGLVVVPLFAGYDLRRKQGRMWKFDVTGGRYEEAEFEATGLGRALRARIAQEVAPRARLEARGARDGGPGAHRRRRRRPRHGRDRHGARDLPDRDLLLGAGHRAGARIRDPRSLRVDPRAPRERAQRSRVVSMPFYVSPEQVMQDKAEYARKGIGRGKSSITLEYAGGIVLMAENPSSLSKIGEIYDRIAFAGVGKFSEFDQLRKIGVRYADIKGYQYSRDDVRGRALANAYSQAIGDAFTRELKPLEVELIVAEVGDPGLVGHEQNEIYRIQYDGSISDHRNFCVIGGSEEELRSHLSSNYRDRPTPRGCTAPRARRARPRQRRQGRGKPGESRGVHPREGADRPKVP